MLAYTWLTLIYTTSLLSGRLASAFDAEHRKQFHFSFDEDHELVNLRAIVESNPAQVRPNPFSGPARETLPVPLARKADSKLLYPCL